MIGIVEHEVFVHLLKGNKMICRICGKIVCTECFHSVEEQEEHEKKEQHKGNKTDYDDGYGTCEGGPAPLD